MKTFFYLIPFLILASCASLGAPFEGLQKAPKDRALLYVYRPSVFGGSARSPEVFANSTKIGTIVNGGYFAAEVSPGDILIQLGGTLGDKTKGFTYKLNAGQTYFYRVDFSQMGLGKHTHADGSMTNEVCAGNAGIPVFKMLTSKDEVSKIIAALDTRVSKDTCTPGLIFVTQDFARDELSHTKQSAPKR